MLTLLPCNADAGLIEVIAGICRTVKLVADVAVDEPTDTVIGPVVAPEGTVTVRLFAVAAVTVARVPLNLTISEDAVVLNAWPWIVTDWPTAPCDGVKFKMASALPGSVERVTESMLPTES